MEQMDEPKENEKIMKCKQEAIEKTKIQGHLIEEWKWDGYGYWRAWCENRNCTGHVWVKLNEVGEYIYGGTGISHICWLKAFKNKEL